MKPVPDCIPDALALVLQTARIVSDDPFIHKKVLMRAMDELADSNLPETPNEVFFRVFAASCKALGVKDPYEKLKARSIKVIAGLEADFQKRIETAAERLPACLDLLMATSVVSRKALGRAEMESAIQEQLGRAPSKDDRQKLLESLGSAKKILYVLGICSSLVLDRLLVEELSKRAEVTVVAQSSPAYEMATAEDAVDAGFSKESLLLPGAEMYGLDLSRASREFRNSYGEHDLVIARGEANYHALNDSSKPVFYLFATGCPFVTAEYGVTSGAFLISPASKQKAQAD